MSRGSFMGFPFTKKVERYEESKDHLVRTAQEIGLTPAYFGWKSASDQDSVKFGAVLAIDKVNYHEITFTGALLVENRLSDIPTDGVVNRRVETPTVSSLEGRLSPFRLDAKILQQDILTSYKEPSEFAKMVGELMREGGHVPRSSIGSEITLIPTDGSHYERATGFSDSYTGVKIEVTSGAQRFVHNRGRISLNKIESADFPF